MTRDKEETSDKNKKAPEKEAGSERAAADAGAPPPLPPPPPRCTRPCLPPCAARHRAAPEAHALLLPEELAVHCRRRRGHRRALRVLPTPFGRTFPGFSMHCSAPWSLPPHAVVSSRGDRSVPSRA